MSDKLEDACNQISEFEIVIADKVNTKEFEAEKARIDSLQADNVEVKKKLTAAEADIEDLKTDNLEVKEKLTANEAEIEDLKAKKLDAEIADIKYATVENLEATNANVHNLEATYGEFKDLATEKFAANEADIKKLQTDKLDASEADIKYATVENLNTANANITRLEAEQGDFKKLTAEKFEANEADIEKLKADKLDATAADLKYANIDFSNIDKAAIENFYATSGIIKDLVIGDTSITGTLVGVTIIGDLIQGGTVKADKLVVKGEDGLYYKLNTEGMKTEVDQNEYNSLNGSIITAKSITATKISVDDLVAFDATIGGFHISEDAIYSGVKASVNNTTRGLFLGSDGQMALGDKDSYLKYYKDQNGKWKLEVTADTVRFGSTKKTVEETVTDIQKDVDSLRDEITTLLRIESSRGTVFKTDRISTVLSVVIYHGTQRITDSATMKSVFGSSAYLQWKWQRIDDDDYGIMSSSDPRFGDNGFAFTLSPDDVDTKVTFMCELIT